MPHQIQNQINGQRTNRLFYYILVISFFCFLFTLATFELDNTQDIDAWFTLKTGQLTVENMAPPKVDVFSYTAAGRPDIDQAWLGQAVFYLFYKIGGIPAVLLFKSFIILLAFFVLYRAVRVIFGQSVLSIILLTLVAVTAANRFNIRPEIFSFLGLAILIYILFTFKYQKKKTIYWLPLLFLFWASLHSEFILGLFIIGIFVFGETLGWWLKNKAGVGIKIVLERKDLIRLWLFFFLSIIATLINPYTYHIYPAVINNIDISSFVKIAEWLPPFSFAYHYELFIFLFIALAVIALFSFLFNYRFLDVTNIIYFVFLVLIAGQSARNISIFAIGVFIILAMNFLVWASGFHLDRLRRFWWLKLAILVVLSSGLLAVCGIIIKYGNEITGSKERYFGLGVDEQYSFSQAMSFLSQSGITGNMMNDYYLGSYLIWTQYPQRKVFVDGRAYIYPKELFIDSGKFYGTKEDLRQAADQYHINYIVEYDSNPLGALQPITENQDWQLVYFDDLIHIYLRKIPANQALLDRYGYKLFDPYVETDQLVDNNKKQLRELYREMLRSLTYNPYTSQAWYTIGRAYLTAGDYQYAEAYYKYLTIIDPEYAHGHFLLGDLYLVEGKSADLAKNEFKKTLQLDPNDLDAQQHLAGFQNK